MTQRMTVATLGGKAAAAVAARFEQWRTALDSEKLDRLCIAIREHALSLHVLYFAEWVDGWLMGNKVPGHGAVEGADSRPRSWHLIRRPTGRIAVGSNSRNKSGWPPVSVRQPMYGTRCLSNA